jgi:hypothetical protein
MGDLKRFCVGCFRRNKSFAAATLQIDDLDYCLACVREQGMDPAEGTPIAAENMPVIDPRLARGRAAISSAAPSAPKEQEMANHVCKCGCGTELSEEAYERGWRYTRGHKPAEGAAKEPTAEAPKKAASAGKQLTCKCGCGIELTPKQRYKGTEYFKGHRAAKLLGVPVPPVPVVKGLPGKGASTGPVAPAPQPPAIPNVTLSVTEAALDRCWSRLDLAGKAVAIQAVLEV